MTHGQSFPHVGLYAGFPLRGRVRHATRIVTNSFTCFYEGGCFSLAGHKHEVKLRTGVPGRAYI